MFVILLLKYFLTNFETSHILDMFMVTSSFSSEVY